MRRLALLLLLVPSMLAAQSATKSDVVYEQIDQTSGVIVPWCSASGQSLKSNGTIWQCATPVWAETDPQVGTLTASNFCLANAGATAIDCTGGTALDHGGLSGLGDDDHPQYGALAQNEIVGARWEFSGMIHSSYAMPGDVVLKTLLSGDEAAYTGQGIGWEGATDNEAQAVLLFSDPLVDISITMPDASGTLWNSGNDGTGSGLDADKLDGNEASSFLDKNDVTNGNFCKGTGTGVSCTDASTYLAAEADTLQTVVARGAVGGVTQVTGYDINMQSGNLILGLDNTPGTPNSAANLLLISTGDNDYYTQIATGTNTQNISYILPPDDGDASEFLQTNGSGTLSWASAAEADTLDTVADRGATTDKALGLPAGGLSTPSVYPTTDANTGLWFPAADTVGLQTDGVGTFSVALNSGADIVGDGGNAALELLDLTNTNEPGTGQIGDTAAISFNLYGSSDSGATFSSAEAARLEAYKIGDWWQASGITEWDAGLKFYTASNGVAVAAMQIDQTGNIYNVGGGAFIKGSTVAASGSMTLGYSVVGSAYGSYLGWEGSTANDYEGVFNFPDVTADRTVTVPDASGTMCVINSGAAPAATCVVGELYIDTDETDDTTVATTNDNSLLVCIAANTWTVIENN